MTVPFCGDGIEGFTFAAEICEDFWAPTPPSTTTALAGAHILCNLSASPITIGKSRERALLCASHSARTVSAYVYTSAGPGESSTDLRSEEHTSELQSLMRHTYAVFCLK